MISQLLSWAEESGCYSHKDKVKHSRLSGEDELIRDAPRLHKSAPTASAGAWQETRRLHLPGQTPGVALKPARTRSARLAAVSGRGERRQVRGYVASRPVIIKVVRQVRQQRLRCPWLNFGVFIIKINPQSKVLAGVMSFLKGSLQLSLTMVSPVCCLANTSGWYMLKFCLWLVSVNLFH